MAALATSVVCIYLTLCQQTYQPEPGIEQASPGASGFSVVPESPFLYNSCGELDQLDHREKCDLRNGYISSFH